MQSTLPHAMPSTPIEPTRKKKRRGLRERENKNTNSSRETNQIAKRYYNQILLHLTPSQLPQRRREKKDNSPSPPPFNSPCFGTMLFRLIFSFFYPLYPLSPLSHNTYPPSPLSPYPPFPLPSPLLPLYHPSDPPPPTHTHHLLLKTPSKTSKKNPLVTVHFVVRAR